MEHVGRTAGFRIEAPDPMLVVKPKAYVETSVVSYLAALPSRDLLVAAHQQVTRDWWTERDAFDLYVSQLVIDEAAAGDQAGCNFTGSTVDDSGYLRGLIEELSERYPVDRKRIYVLGHSNGGFMAHRMAQDHGDLIAGIVRLAGAPILDAGVPHPPQPVNILQVHGTADDVVPFPGEELNGLPITGRFPGAVETAALWAGYNGCAGPRWDSEVTFDLDLAVLGPDTVVLRYDTSPRGGDVELWSILGGGHDPALSGEFATRVVDWLLQRPSLDRSLDQ